MNHRILPGALIASALVALTASAALAGPADSPIPSISGTAATRSMFIVPGVIKNNGLETAFMCTSLDTAAATVAVEVFSPAGGGPLNNVATGSLDGTLPLAPGASITISTGSSVGLHEDLAISGLVNVKNGSARILSTTTRIACTALLVEKAGTTPATVATLKLISQRKQNGD